MLTKLSSFFKSLFRALSDKEKAIIGILAISAITCGAFLIYQDYYYNTTFVPDYGGVYQEGVISQKSSDLTSTINRLTKIGLTKFDKDGNIIPEVASSWEISDDVKSYTFTISDKFPRDEVLTQLQKQKDRFAGIVIEPVDSNKIKFSFSQSYSPFLAETTNQVLDFGPFILQTQTNSELVFMPRSDFYLGKPYLSELVLKIYPDLENLTKAFKAGEIDGVFDTYNQNWPQTSSYQFNLQRYNIVFLNTTREVVKDKDIRKKIAGGEKIESGLKLMVVSLDTPKYHQIIDDLINKWKAQNIQTDVYYKSASDLANTIIPKRDYDVLVYGLDYGRDPDPYPFWHSTQASETGDNLSNFSNIDADKLLEASRQTKDKAERDKDYTQFWQIFNDEMPAIIISQDQWQFAVSNKVKSIETGYSITPADRFYNVEKWYIKTKRVKK